MQVIRKFEKIQNNKLIINLQYCEFLNSRGNQIEGSFRVS